MKGDQHMNNLTKDDFLEIENALNDVFAGEGKSQELLKKHGFTPAQIQIMSLMISCALREYHTMLTGEIVQ